jgi:eukaryotic-like serine/threonine-protein kinase
MDVQVVGGRYEISKQLARGGFGNTFLAFDIQKPDNPKRLIKHFKPVTTDPLILKHAKRLFEQEATILMSLGAHEQIPQFFDHFEENEEFYLVEEYIDGHDITEELPPYRSLLSESETIVMLKEILEVLAFVHQKNVIHRDIKPSNIRRRIDGKIILIDFGAVKQIITSFVNTQGEAVLTVPVGTPGYMPSEQASGKPQFSSDVYAVGIIAIQALTGIVPGLYGNTFPTDPVTGEIIWRHLANVSFELADFIDNMIRYDFRQRYQTADFALAALSCIPANTDIDRSYVYRTPVQNLIQNSIQNSIQTPIHKPKPLGTLLLGIGTLASVGLIGLINLNTSLKSEQLLPCCNSNQFKITYPATWARQDDENKVTGQVVKFISQQKNISDDFQGEVTITITKSDQTLEESMNDFIKSKIDSKANILYKSTAITLANKQANKLIFTRDEGSHRFKYLQVWTLKNDELYLITYVAEKSQYDNFIHVAEKMINSFELND